MQRGGPIACRTPRSEPWLVGRLPLAPPAPIGRVRLLGEFKLHQPVGDAPTAGDADAAARVFARRALQHRPHAAVDDHIESQLSPRLPAVRRAAARKQLARGEPVHATAPRAPHTATRALMLRAVSTLDMCVEREFQGGESG